MSQDVFLESLKKHALSKYGITLTSDNLKDATKEFQEKKKEKEGK